MPIQSFQLPSILLTNKDCDLALRLRATLEAETQKTVSLSELIRIALRELAKAKGV